jgi:signal peptidase I
MSVFAAAHELVHVARQVLMFGSACWALDRYVVHMTTTEGPSMSPTLSESGDIVLVDKLSPRFRAFAIRRGDIVVADSSYKASYTVCKRVVALEGDTVTPAHDPGAALTVPSGHVWLEGDNVQDSTDSRAYGPVPTALVRGRVVARVWPLSALTVFRPSHPRPTINHVLLEQLLNDSNICLEAERRVVARHAAALAERDGTLSAALSAAEFLVNTTTKQAPSQPAGLERKLA